MYAQYTEKTYTLTINPNSGTWNGSTSSSTRTLKYSDVINIPNPTRSSYTFTGWSQLSNYTSYTGLTGIGKYDWNSLVTFSSISKSSDNPLTFTSSEYKITNPGTSATQPGLGGFVQVKTSEANKVYVHVFVAKVPAGYYLHNASNAIGGGTREWLTSNEGTGNWQTYVYKVTTGSSGTFETFGHVFVSKSPERSLEAMTESFTWNLAYSNIYDITSNNNGIGQIDGSATLTASWALTVTSMAYNSSYTYRTYTIPADGNYKIELWGAQGGNAKYTTQYYGGNGAYTAGTISMKKNEVLNIYIGGMGTSHSGTSTDTVTANGSGYNGGDTGIFYSNNSNGGGGGGATDVRLTAGSWDNFNSLKSRIMVAAGGGGADSHVNTPDYSGNGGAAGGLTGYAADKKGACYRYGAGGTQTSGGQSIACSSTYTTGITGAFGNGGTSHGGGGGGYYGGGYGQHTSGAGGSSFISGYAGCRAITESSTASNITHSTNVTHYSGKSFTSVVMIDGKGCNWATGSAKSCGANQPQPSGSNTTGHSGSGYARVTIVSLT